MNEERMDAQRGESWVQWLGKREKRNERRGRKKGNRGRGKGGGEKNERMEKYVLGQFDLFLLFLSGTTLQKVNDLLFKKW